MDKEPSSLINLYSHGVFGLECSCECRLAARADQTAGGHRASLVIWTSALKNVTQSLNFYEQCGFLTSTWSRCCSVTFIHSPCLVSWQTFMKHPWMFSHQKWQRKWVRCMCACGICLWTLSLHNFIFNKNRNRLQMKPFLKLR